jgi:hypothetical protein
MLGTEYIEAGAAGRSKAGRLGYDGTMSTMLKGLVIGRSTGRCAETEAELAVGTPCIAALVRPLATETRTDRPVLERLDFDPAAWEAGDAARRLGDRLLCWWRTEIPDPGSKRQMFVDDETLVDLFERMVAEEEADSGRRAFRFVLGLILLRRRKIRMVDRRRDGDDDVWVLKRVGGGDDAPLWSVTDPRLSDEDADAIAEQLSTILADEG